MRHFEAGDEVAGALAAEYFDDGVAYSLGNVIHFCPQRWLDVGPLIDLFDGNDQRVAVRDRLDGEERGDVLVLVHEAAWNFTLNNLCKHSAHNA